MMFACFGEFVKKILVTELSYSRIAQSNTEKKELSVLQYWQKRNLMVLFFEVLSVSGLWFQRISEDHTQRAVNKFGSKEIWGLIMFAR